jgi:hypothetical protein
LLWENLTSSGERKRFTILGPMLMPQLLPSGAATRSLVERSGEVLREFGGELLADDSSLLEGSSISDGVSVTAFVADSMYAVSLSREGPH